jgi:hypothetical protein
MILVALGVSGDGSRRDRSYTKADSDHIET